LDKLLEYKRNWIQRVNRMPRNRLPRTMKHYSPTGRMNHGRPLKRLLDTWDRNRSKSGPTAWKIDDDNDDDDHIPQTSLYRSDRMQEAIFKFNQPPAEVNRQKLQKLSIFLSVVCRAAKGFK
jgi:hypothetical protein